MSTSAVTAEPDPPCATGVAPNATIRGFDIERGGRTLTATHTITPEAYGPDGEIPNATFTLPAGAQDRTTGSDQAFSLDKPGPVTISATWSHDTGESTCTASAQGTLQLRVAKPIRFDGPPPPRTSGGEYFQSLIRVGPRGDLRPVELRLSGVRRARLPGPDARVQTAKLALRGGDPGISPTANTSLRTAGWKFTFGFVEGDVLIVSKIEPPTARRIRGRTHAFGWVMEFVQAGRRIGRMRVTGRCGYVRACEWHARG